MKTFFLKFFDIKFWKFLLVGIANTIVGAGIMFLFYNVFHFDYWTSSASNYVFGSILSYFLNKRFTFDNHEKERALLGRFILNISICYGLAYGIAKPVMREILSGAAVSLQENCAMLAGMIVFTGLNYIGQRYYVFHKSGGK